MTTTSQNSPSLSRDRALRIVPPSPRLPSRPLPPMHWAPIVGRGGEERRREQGVPVWPSLRRCRRCRRTLRLIPIIVAVAVVVVVRLARGVLFEATSGIEGIRTMGGAEGGGGGGGAQGT